jgi:hypothetical protein
MRELILEFPQVILTERQVVEQVFRAMLVFGMDLSKLSGERLLHCLRAGAQTPDMRNQLLKDRGLS